MTLTRRQFLLRSGAAAGGLLMVSGCSLIPALPTFGGPEAGDEFAWVQIGQDGTVLFNCPRAEMGQGIVTSLAQVVAEELKVPPSAVNCAYPTTAEIPPAKMTVGSESIELFTDPLALSAASLREVLRRRASVMLSVDADDLTLQNGEFKAGGNTITFADLMTPGPIEILEAEQLQPPPTLFSKSETPEIVGRPTGPIDCEAIVTGREIYSRDVVIENLAFGAIARPPWLGAELKSCNEQAASNIDGVVQVVAEGGQVGVVAETPMALRAGLEALDCQWEKLSDSRRELIDEINDIDKTLAESTLDHTPVSEGDVSKGSSQAVQQIDVRYDTPLVAHASMEPRAGVAYFDGKTCVVHTGSQDPWYVRSAVAKALGMSNDDVLVQNHRLGGGFGGRIHCQASVEAAWLAKAAKRPVKVQWTREEEFTRNYGGPAFSHRINAGVDANGRICSWHHQMVGSPILTTSALIPPNLHWAADLVADPGTWRGAETSYQLTNQLVEFSDIRRPMPTGAWRGLGAAPNTFAVECAMDELALAADIDPIQFRINHAMNPRLARVLEILREQLKGSSAAGVGIAANAYKGVTFAAVAAEVDATGKLSKLWCVHDCGRVINPDRVRAQVEGCLVWGIGSALSEDFVVENGIGRTSNFNQYQVPRIHDVPEFAIELVNSNESSSGAGEAAFPPTAAAIVNAMARLGERARSLPVS